MRRLRFMKSGLMLLLATALFPLAVLANHNNAKATLPEEIYLQRGRTIYIAQNTTTATSASPAQAAAPASTEAVAAPSAPASGEQITAPSSDEWSALLKSMGGVKGAGTLGIIALIVQAILLLGRSSLGAVAGKWRYILVVGLTWVSGFLALKLQGNDWLASLMHPATMAAFQVLVHQGVIQLGTKKGDA